MLLAEERLEMQGRHSLVTPIDWKLARNDCESISFNGVAILW